MTHSIAITTAIAEDYTRFHAAQTRNLRGMEASLFRRLSRVEFAGQLLHCPENVELRSLVVWLFLALFEIFFGSHIVGHITPPVQ